MAETEIAEIAINITPMTETEARQCVDAIKGNLDSLRGRLLELQRREGWKVLGYSSWRECSQKEFGQSQGYVYKLLHAAEVEENLTNAGFIQLDKSDNSESIPINQLEELHKLPAEKQIQGLQKADQLAQAEGKPRTATHVAKAVREISKSESPKPKFIPGDICRVIHPNLECFGEEVEIVRPIEQTDDMFVGSSSIGDKLFFLNQLEFVRHSDRKQQYEPPKQILSLVEKLPIDEQIKLIETLLDKLPRGPRFILAQKIKGF